MILKKSLYNFTEQDILLKTTVTQTVPLKAEGHLASVAIIQLIRRLKMLMRLG